MSKDARAEEGFTVHAGADETSQLLFLRPDLVAPDLDKAPSLTAHDFADHIRIAKAEGWTGYFGAPRLATAAMGAVEFQRSSQNVIKVALQILDGLDYRSIPRYADEMDPLDAAGEADQLEHERAVERRQAEWLKAHKLQ
jgi:creatinine amidohydrolase